jgi:glycosyltransferase involved in cell wall biosynthesis
MRIWIDVSEFVMIDARPTGILRTLIQLTECWRSLAPGEVHLFHCDEGTKQFRTYSWELWDSKLERQRKSSGQADFKETVRSYTQEKVETSSPGQLRRLLRLIPDHEIRANLAEIARVGFYLKWAVRGLFRSLISFPRRRFRDRATGGSPLIPALRPGDALFFNGVPRGSHSIYLDFLVQNKEKLNLRVIQYCYDVIPARRPEWVMQTVEESFFFWFRNILPLSDEIFTCSEYSRNETQSLAEELALKIATPQVSRLGDDFHPHSKQKTDPPAPLKSLLNRRFILAVGTVEPRKNHRVLVQAWEEVLARNPADCPDLVIVGQPRPNAEYIRSEWQRNPRVQGRLWWFEQLGDDCLELLFKACEFTVFPSLYEGWGLPVTESLSHGKVCLASNTSSVPEAGGKLAVYCDPLNLREIERKIEELSTDRELLRKLSERIQLEYRPIAWTETAAEIFKSFTRAPQPPEATLHASTPSSPLSEIHQKLSSYPQ